MTDPELIQLVQDKAPEELSVAEIELLRERLRHSPELRETLLEQLHMEEYVSRALGRVAVSVDSIYAAAAARKAGKHRVLALLGWTGALGVGVAVLLWMVLSNVDPHQLAGRRAPAGGVAPAKVNPIVPPAGEGTGTEATTENSEPVVEPVAIAEKPPEGSVPAATKKSGRPADPLPPPVAASVDEFPELSPKAPRRAFLDAAFEDADGNMRGISKNQLSRWFAPVLGQNHNFTETNRANVVVAAFDGMIRLRAPWPADAVLEMAPFDHHGMAIYFWNGLSGVSLHFYHYPRPMWVAFRTTRKGPEPKPSTFALLANDNDRYDRTLAGALEVRHQSGSLVLNRGDLRLLTCPFEGLPTEVYFEKHAAFRTFTMYRGEKVPDDAPVEELNVLADNSPGALTWTTQLGKGVRFDKLGDGSMQLAADKDADLSWATAKLPRPGLYEIVFRLGDMSPGTGFVLGDDAGKPVHVLAIVRDQKTSQTVLAFLPPTANWFETAVDLANQPGPLCAAGQWVRLVAGSGTIKCWTSGDGRHWSRAFDPLRGVRGAWSQVGLVAFKTVTPRRITLEHLRVSELGAVSGLADEKLREQVPASVFTADTDLAAWQARVKESQPAGADPDAWRAACAVRTLAVVPSATVGNALLNELLEKNLLREVDAAERVRVLNEAAQIYDSWEQPPSYQLSQFYERLGKRLLQEGDREPWTKAGRSLLTAPIWTVAQFQAIPESLANPELLFRVYADQWDEVYQLCRRLRFFNRPSIPEQTWPEPRQRIRLLVEWASANADRALADNRRNGNAPSPVSFYWQHPLSVSLSKEGFNTLAELEATLGDQSYRDACQIILGVKPELALGLLPDGRDPRLMLSLPQAVDTAMRDFPGLRQTMVEQFGTLGRLRLKQALADASPALLEALAVQFFGTSSAAEAHQWLGDRALADGDFAQAAAQFELALHSAEVEQRAPLAARLRLAGAMLGRDEGPKVTEPVVFHDARMTAEAFEKLIAEMKEHAVAVGGAPLVATETVPLVGVKPVRYEVQGRGALPGDVGLNPGNSLAGEVDWAARQMASTAAGKMLYLSNRFQVSAYSLVTGKQHWSAPMGKEMAPTHSWGLSAMQPVVVGDRLLVRRLAKTGPELVCFNAVNGKIRWTSRLSVNIASDPLILQDRMYVFTVATPADDGLLSLDLSLINPLTGEILAQQPVIQLRNLWDKQLNCQAAVVGTRLVAVTGGTVVCCDFTGKPLWVRRQMWIPSMQAPAANEQSAGIPLVLGNRLFVSQPGVFAAECLDLDTGRRIWQQPLPDIRRLIGVSGDKLVVETAKGWQAYAAANGKLIWRHDAEQILDAHVCPNSGDLLVSQREPHANDTFRPVLVWINSETGRETARLPLDPLADKQPMLGPLVVSNNRLWALFGRGLKEPRRELFELTPTADPAQPPRATAAIR